MSGRSRASNARASGGPVRALVTCLLLLASCAGYERFATPSMTDPTRHDVLAPYEAARWPAFLRRLDLARARDYVILAFVPTNHPFDLSSHSRARASLLEAAASPGLDTRIGHLIVGWQCGPHQGMTSMTGAQGPEADALLKNGWGFAAALSTFTDGYLYPEGEHRLANLEALAAGRGVVMAVEVRRSDCAAMRAELGRFLTHPNAPVKNYGLRHDPAAYEGAGCISFGFYLANAAGILDEVSDRISREVTLHAPMLGQGPEGAARYRGVVLYSPPDGCCSRPMPLAKLLLSRWDDGPVVDRVRVEDGELVLAALVAAREGVAPSDDWRFARRLPEARDPWAARAALAGRRFAGSYPVTRIADPEGVSALVLERN